MATSLKMKIEQESNREKSRKRSKKYRDSKEILLVEEFKSQYGSLRKASIATNVQWPTFHRLCRPVQHKIKAKRQTWVDPFINLIMFLKSCYQHDAVVRDI